MRVALRRIGPARRRDVAQLVASPCPDVDETVEVVDVGLVVRAVGLPPLARALRVEQEHVLEPAEVARSLGGVAGATATCEGC